MLGIFYSLSHHLLYFISYSIRIKSILCDTPTVTQLFTYHYYCYLLSITDSFLLYINTVEVFNYSCSFYSQIIYIFIVVVGDINIEELRKHAVEITIDRERLHPDLTLSKDCKTVRDSKDYQHTGEGFPFELCAFGAQRFTSGRHYWEVQLVQTNTAPKNYWLIGVVKHGHFTARDRSALTPSAGFWFLCSDGPQGFHINTDPPVKLSLTPRPEQLGVLFDYDEGLLAFYNVTESKHLLTISSRFSGSVVPLFNPGAGDLSPLKILDCPKPVESTAEPPAESAVESSDDP
uniref:B30.2/SPRY domain-containing protein n=1 Tax=Sinocyclocheilus grahami TaxID=75366 RepID=A0A672K1H3_SINGR